MEIYKTYGFICAIVLLNLLPQVTGFLIDCTHFCWSEYSSESTACDCGIIMRPNKGEPTQSTTTMPLTTSTTDTNNLTSVFGFTLSNITTTVPTSSSSSSYTTSPPESTSVPSQTTSPPTTQLLSSLSASSSEPSTVTTTSAHTRHTTLSVCDYLCSIQMGGAACDCSAPILPGK